MVQYRALVARANYLSQDRGDIGFAVKERCRSMAAPRECDWTKLKRLGRYLVGNTSLVAEFAYQQRLRRISVWTDSDFGGCKRTRKSTSGGCADAGRALDQVLVCQPGSYSAVIRRGGVLRHGKGSQYRARSAGDVGRLRY